MAAQEKAAEIAETLAEADDFAAAVTAAGLESNATELVTRGSVLATVGVSPAVDAVAFALPVGGTSDVIDTDTGLVIVRVVEREDVTEEDFAAAQEALRIEVLAEQQSRFFGAYMAKAMERMQININQEVLQRALA